MRAALRRPPFRSEYLRVVLSAAAICGQLACRATPASAPPPTPAVSADTWATVDGHAITKDDVEKAYRRTRDASQPTSDEETMTAKLGILDDLIVQQILLVKAGGLNLDVPQTELDTAYANASKNIAPEAYQQELTRRNLTAADMREGLRRQLLTQKVVEREVSSKIAVTDQEVTDAFNANRAQFNVPEESYRIAQIVVTPVRDERLANGTGDDATTAEAAAAKVRMLMDRLKAGAPFGELAAGYSEDPESAPRGGDLGLVPVSRLRQAPAPLRDAVIGKSPGTVTVATLGGAHTIVLVVGHELAGQRDLSTPEVRERISSTLRGRKEQLLRTAYLSAIRSDARIVNYAARRLVEGQGKMPTAPLAPPAK